MSEYHSGAYFVRRGGRSGKGKRAAGILIAVLMLLTAAICLLVVFLPKLTAATVGADGFGGKRFYFLATGKYEDRSDALFASQDAINRGGAGYIYNDGAYNVIASVYDSESDAKALASVNENSYYFEISVPKLDTGNESDLAALKFLTGEWFSAVQTAADELQRGNATEAQAENAAVEACFKLSVFAESVGLPALGSALERASECECPKDMPLLAYLRYVHVRAISLVVKALA